MQVRTTSLVDEKVRQRLLASLAALAVSVSSDDFLTNGSTDPKAGATTKASTTATKGGLHGES